MKPQVGQQVKLKPKFRTLLSKMFFDNAPVNPWATVEVVYHDDADTYDVYVSTLDETCQRKGVTVWATRRDFTVPKKEVS